MFGPGPTISQYSVMAVLLYNGVVLAAVVGTLCWIASQRSARGLLIGLVGGLAAGLPLVGVLALVVSGLFAGGVFMVMGLLAHGLFGHGLIFLVASAGLLRRRAPRIALATGLTAVTLLALTVYAFCWEPYQLEVRTVRLTSAKLTRPVRIVVVADLQTDRIGEYEREVFRRVMALRPDLVLLPGDFLQIWDDAQRKVAAQQLRELLRELKFSAPLGIYAVNGNTDGPDWPTIFEGLPVQTIGQSQVFQTGELQITALKMWDSFDTRIVVEGTSRYHIVFGHGPDFALGQVDADLLVAGHTHGGQVRLPWPGPWRLRPLLTFSEVPRDWAQGVTTLSGGRTLVVSRGVGMERGSAPRLRFLCRPELVVIEISPR